MDEFARAAASSAAGGVLVDSAAGSAALRLVLGDAAADQADAALPAGSGGFRRGEGRARPCPPHP
jgi:hypothetical protein